MDMFSFSGNIPSRSRIAGSYDNCVYFLRNCQTVFILHSHQQLMRAPISVAARVNVCLFHYRHPGGCEVGTSGFGLHLPEG